MPGVGQWKGPRGGIVVCFVCVCVCVCWCWWIWVCVCLCLCLCLHQCHSHMPIQAPRRRRGGPPRRPLILHVGGRRRIRRSASSRWRAFGCPRQRHRGRPGRFLGRTVLCVCVCVCVCVPEKEAMGSCPHTYTHKHTHTHLRKIPVGKHWCVPQQLMTYIRLGCIKRHGLMSYVSVCVCVCVCMYV